MTFSKTAMVWCLVLAGCFGGGGGDGGSAGAQGGTSGGAGGAGAGTNAGNGGGGTTSTAGTAVPTGGTLAQTGGVGAGGAAGTGSAGTTAGVGAGVGSAGTDGMACPPECLRAYTCAATCDDEPFNNGCCACPAGTIDTITCSSGGGAGHCTVPCTGAAPDEGVVAECQTITSEADCVAYASMAFPYACTWQTSNEPCLAP